MQKNTEIQLATQEATEEIADWTLSGVVIDGLGGLFLALAGFIAFRTYRQTVRHADAAEKTLAQTVAQAKQSAIDGEKQIVAAQRQAAAAEKQLSEAIAANKKSIAASERLARMTELQAKANINAIQEESKLRALSVRPKFLFYEADVKITHDTIHIIARIKNEGDYTIRDLTFAYAIGFSPTITTNLPDEPLEYKEFFQDGMHTTLPHNDFSSIEVEFPREQLEIDLGEGEDYFFFLWTKSLWRDPLGWDVWQKDALRGLATVGDDDFKLQKIVALDFRVSPPDGERLKLIQINEPIPPIVARKTL